MTASSDFVLRESDVTIENHIITSIEGGHNFNSVNHTLVIRWILSSGPNISFWMEYDVLLEWERSSLGMGISIDLHDLKKKGAE